MQLGAQALTRVWEQGDEELAAHAIECGLVSYLLELLEAPHQLAADSPRAAVAQLVQAIKTLQAKTVRHSQRINELLDASTAWRQYRDQLHDLFVQSTQVAGYLQG